MKRLDKKNILDIDLKVINIGIKIFYDSLRSQDSKVIHVDWQPPAGGESDLANLIDKLS